MESAETTAEHASSGFSAKASTLLQSDYLPALSGFVGATGCDGCSFANDESTRLLKSPASSFPSPLKALCTCISQEVSPLVFNTTVLVRFWLSVPPMENEAVISPLSIDMIPYFPELRSVSFTAGHRLLHGIG